MQFPRIRISCTWVAGEITLAESMVDDWMNSPGHRANMLESDYSDIGIGVHIYGHGSVSPPRTFARL